MTQKILITYATRAGSTREIAETIANELKDLKIDTDVIPCSEVTDLSKYQAVVIGGPVYMGKVLADIPTFVKKFEISLSSIPVAVFIVGIPIAEPSQERKDQAKELVNKTFSPIKVMDFKILAGRLDKTKISFWQRKLSELMKSEFGDFRDFEAIRTFAKSLPDQFGFKN